MKPINVIFDDEEIKPIKELKEKLKLSWHDLIIKLVNNYKEDKENA